MVQLNPSVKRDTRGRAVDSKSSYCVVGGGCTWSNVKTCFLGPEPPDEACGVCGPPAPPEGVSIETEVEELACMTERWKRAGMDVESCVVGGRIRRAEIHNETQGYDISSKLHSPTCTDVAAADDDDDEVEGAMAALLKVLELVSFTQIKPLRHLPNFPCGRLIPLSDDFFYIRFLHLCEHTTSFKNLSLYHAYMTFDGHLSHNLY